MLQSSAFTRKMAGCDKVIKRVFFKKIEALWFSLLKTSRVRLKFERIDKISFSENL